MKQNFFIIVALFCLSFAAVSCEDLLETESHRQTFDPALDSKIDSMYYTLGMLKGVQQAIDQNFLFNEMRGDLTTVNQYTSADLRSLANFTATTENKYDSAYVFYRIINNCNYFLAHRDTTLYTGSRNVTIPEYVQALSIRAWAYIQLTKFYGSVPFFTDPVTSISEANEVHEKKDIRGICEALAADLEKFSGTQVPTYGSEVSVGYTNRGSEKIVNTSLMMFPVDIVLGDLYLEAGLYDNAARAYFTFLRNQQSQAIWYRAFTDVTDALSYLPVQTRKDLPGDVNFSYSSRTYERSSSWGSHFLNRDPSDIITYVPMAVNKLRGAVTDLPRLFGFDYYYTGSTSATDDNGIYIEEREIDPSQAYFNLSNAQTFYYVPQSATTDRDNVKELTIGDLRRFVTLQSATINDSSFYVNQKIETANIPIYRGTMVYLRLAEAINRAGYPDAAFAILKDGLNSDLAEDSLYMRPATQEYLRNTLPFFSEANINYFLYNHGIHSYGSGYTAGAFTGYQMDSEIAKKIAELNEKLGIGVEPIITETQDEEGNVSYSYSWTLEDQINAVEDLICDEYALEFAFEGTRFGDLCRLARHKNDAGLYGGNFGSRWLANKLAFKTSVDLTQQQNWYLPLGK